MARRRSKKQSSSAPAPDARRAQRTEDVQRAVQAALASLYGDRGPAAPSKPERPRQARPQPPTIPAVKAALAPAPRPAAKPAPKPGKSRAPRANFAFIDGTNLNVSIRHMGWRMDWAKFRAYLRETWNVEKAFYFMGFVEEHQEIYDFLKEVGFELVFKETIVTRDGEIKGNIDADLVLHTMIELPRYDGAVLVTGDGDFASLVAHLRSVGKLAVLLVPNKARYSSFLDEAAGGNIASVSSLRAKLAYRAPSKAS